MLRTLNMSEESISILEKFIAKTLIPSQIDPNNEEDILNVFDKVSDFYAFLEIIKRENQEKLERKNELEDITALFHQLYTDLAYVSNLPVDIEVDSDLYFLHDRNSKLYFKEKINAESAYLHLFKLNFMINNYADIYHDVQFEGDDIEKYLIRIITSFMRDDVENIDILDIGPKLSKSLSILQVKVINLLYVENMNKEYRDEFSTEFDRHKTAAKNYLLFEHPELRLYNKPIINLEKSTEK